MNLIIGNPAGFWALLGIPVVLLIHFLQKERREIVTSTLFLLENQQRESKSGIRLERLRNSIPLWLQIFSVLLLTWLFLQPLWLRPGSYQRSVIVLDSSASMIAFQDEILDALKEITADLGRFSLRQEWILLETDRRRETLYSGDDREALLATAANWKPRAGTHSPENSLNDARSLLRGAGTVIFLSDRIREEIPSGVHEVAIGTPIENCGFTGVRLEQTEDGLIWNALVRNYGQIPQSREWQAVFNGQPGAPQPLQLDPGQTVSLRGKFPDDATEGFLQLTEDRFHLDDWLPLIRPLAKPLAIEVEDHPLLDPFAENFLKSLSDWHSPDSTSADLRFATRLPGQSEPENPGIYFLVEDPAPGRFLIDPLVSENHSLTRELNWQGLLVQREAKIPIEEDDRVLLWQGEYPLIVLRTSGRTKSLFCNFDLRHSNAGRLPAFVILLHRFLNEVRLDKEAFSRENLQTGQVFPIATDPLGPSLSILFRDRVANEFRSEAPARSQRLLAPGEPGFIEIRQGEKTILQGAVHFADSREADFRDATSQTSGPDPKVAMLEKNTTADFLTPLWLVLLGGIMIASWWFTGRSAQT